VEPQWNRSETAAESQWNRSGITVEVERNRSVVIDSQRGGRFPKSFAPEEKNRTRMASESYESVVRKNDLNGFRKLRKCCSSFDSAHVETREVHQN
jgi:hypothetical protein